jgi:hypothetical protein
MFDYAAAFIAKLNADYDAKYRAEKAYREAGEAAIEAQRRMYEQSKIIPAPRAVAHPTQCDNCGSSDYVPHNGRLICSYCRTAPGAPTVVHLDTSRVADTMLTRLDLCYGFKTLRPEMAVRISDPRPCKGEV